MSKIVEFPIQSCSRLSNPSDKVLVTAFAQAVCERLNEEYPDMDDTLTAIEAHAAVGYVLEEFLGIEHAKSVTYCCGKDGAVIHDGGSK